MQHKHEIKSNRIKVFLSSSMATDRFMEQRAAIVTLLERMELVDIFAIENHSSPQRISEYYVSQVQRSDVVIMILQDMLREGVYNEFQAAKRNGIRIFGYIHNGAKTPELEQFIKDELHSMITTGYFGSTKELVDKIESDLLEDIANTYKYLTKEFENLKKQLDKYNQYIK